MKTLFKTQLIAIICFFISSSLFSQTGSLKGKITDKKTGEPIPFANVIVESKGESIATAVSAINGSYNISSIKSGKYNIKVSYVGYTSVMVSNVIINPGKTTNLDVKMESSTASLETTEVILYKTPDSTKPAAGSTDSRRDYVHEELDGAVAPKAYKSEASYTRSYEKRSSAKGKDYEDTYAPAAGITTGRAGALTAGEINDFSKWIMWQDIAATSLNQHQKDWSFNPLHRITLQLTNEQMIPIIDAQVKLLNKEKIVLWTSKTDNTGKAELWTDLMGDSIKTLKNYTLEISYESKLYTIQDVKKFKDGINHYKIPAKCNIPNAVDIMFVVDATGSMSDEIEYLKAELDDIIGKVKNTHKELDLALGSVFYRDLTDEYVTRKSDLSDDIDKTINFIKAQYAGGGGDFPEAVDSALDVAINNIKWRSEARSRLLFLVLDAPPHNNMQVKQKLEKLMKKASELGIRIIPVTGSGIDKSTEYLMRIFALASNGTYTFLTNHSGIGGHHIEPTTDKYEVELLNALLLRLINTYVFVPDCQNKFTFEDKNIKDTAIVEMPDTMPKTTVDSLKTNQNKDSTKLITKTDTLKNNPPLQVAWKYYPNPTSGPLTVEIYANIGELFLTDMSGKILQRFIVKEAQKIELDLSIYPSGPYFLRYAYATDKLISGKVLLVR